jgi:two-component system response regulator YesN
MDYNRIFPALNAMEHQLSKGYTLVDYADMCNMSKYHFVHTFKKHTGQSPMQYKNSIAMEQAKYFLAHSDMTIGEIAEATGISDSMYFSKKFRNYAGCSPREYRYKKK